jgi:hypothetical protein
MPVTGRADREWPLWPGLVGGTAYSVAASLAVAQLVPVHVSQVPALQNAVMAMQSTPHAEAPGGMHCISATMAAAWYLD